MKPLWEYSTIHKSACKVVDEQTLWGQTVCRVWLPNQDAVVRVPKSDLQELPMDAVPSGHCDDGCRETADASKRMGD